MQKYTDRQASKILLRTTNLTHLFFSSLPLPIQCLPVYSYMKDCKFRAILCAYNWLLESSHRGCRWHHFPRPLFLQSSQLVCQLLCHRFLRICPNCRKQPGYNHQELALHRIFDFDAQEFLLNPLPLCTSII